MRGSRIPHPAGGRHVKVWRWAVEAVGKEAATVLGEIEWRDRVREEPGQPVATRSELIAALEGFVSRNKVDDSLDLLRKLDWVRRHECSTLGERNLRTWLEFSLNAEAITEFLRAPPVSPVGETGVPGGTESPISPVGDPGIPPLGTEAGTEVGTPSNSEPQPSPPPSDVVVVRLAKSHAAALRGAAAAAKLSPSDVQRLADALAGALELPAGDRRRPGNVLKWLNGTAAAIAAGDFVEGNAFLAGRAARQAVQAADPVRAAADAAEHQRRLEESASQIRRAMVA